MTLNIKLNVRRLVGGFPASMVDLIDVEMFGRLCLLLIPERIRTHASLSQTTQVFNAVHCVQCLVVIKVHADEV
jgi:hypothetical protein